MTYYTVEQAKELFNDDSPVYLAREFDQQIRRPYGVVVVQKEDIMAQLELDSELPY